MDCSTPGFLVTNSRSLLKLMSVMPFNHLILCRPLLPSNFPSFRVFSNESGIYMEIRKMVTITLYARQQKRHRCMEHSFGLYGRGWGWDNLGEWHWNMYNIIYETNHQSRFDSWYWMPGAGALRRPRGIVQGGRREKGSGWGIHVYLWWIHVNVWQNQHNIVK